MKNDIKTKKKVAKKTQVWNKPVSISDKDWRTFWDKEKTGLNVEGIRNNDDEGIDVPIHMRGGMFQWNFEEKKDHSVKIMWVLAVLCVLVALFAMYSDGVALSEGYIH